MSCQKVSSVVYMQMHYLTCIQEKETRDGKRWEQEQSAREREKQRRQKQAAKQGSAITPKLRKRGAKITKLAVSKDVYIPSAISVDNLARLLNVKRGKASNTRIFFPELILAVRKTC